MGRVPHRRMVNEVVAGECGEIAPLPGIPNLFDPRPMSLQGHGHAFPHPRLVCHVLRYILARALALTGQPLVAAGLYRIALQCG